MNEAWGVTPPRLSHSQIAMGIIKGARRTQAGWDSKGLSNPLPGFIVT